LTTTINDVSFIFVEVDSIFICKTDGVFTPPPPTEDDRRAVGGKGNPYAAMPLQTLQPSASGC
jgi:hypothetical protein